uniref:WD_REPEATS_REGION domain-containing protein n=1 Tax=Macrostomum lignano TaxID=282301 RepID=A0A1I8GC58_9PLAT
NPHLKSEQSEFAAAGGPESPRSSPKREAGVGAKKLTVSQVTQTTVVAKETVNYCKETQTMNLEPERDVLTYDESEREGEGVNAAEALAELQRMPHVQELVAAGAAADGAAPVAAEPEKPRELSDEERQQILLSESFVRFFDKTARVMERALAEDVDIFIDYSGGSGDTELGETAKQQVKQQRVFYDDRWSRNRCVTALDWSPHFPELCLAAYNANEDAPQEPDGVVCVWNVKFRKDSPEFVFHCQSPVTSACFAKFHRNLIVGGTYSGQVVLWDNRTPRRTPVQRSPLSSTAHTQPVLSVCVLGSENAHNLVSASSDGRLCTWSLDMLSQPQETLDLQRQNRPVPATCLDFAPSDANHFVVGSEDYSMYTGCRHGAKAGIMDALDGHQGPVSAVATHRATGPVDLGHIVLSASFDWTVRLWSLRDLGTVHVFEETSDYVMDLCWSPVNPALFCAADALGRLDFWQLNLDTEQAAARAQCDAAVNRCRFSDSGLLLGAGDHLGRLTVFELADSLASPRQEEWKLLGRTLHELKQATAELAAAEQDPPGVGPIR